MDGTFRLPPLDLEKNLGDPTAYCFFQLNRILERVVERLNRSESENPISIRYMAHASLGFAASDIIDCQLKTLHNETLIELTQSFFGLYGPESPLPAFYSERVIQNDDIELPSRHLMDMFTHQYMALMQKSWSKYRYYDRYQPQGQDSISQWLGGLSGHSLSSLQENKAIQWNKLLPFVGLLANGICSYALLIKVIKSYFCLANVEIDAFQVRTVQVPDDQQCKLGSVNSSLGEDLVVGDTILDVGGKFSLRLFVETYPEYYDFLPLGARFAELVALVKLLLKDPLEFTVSVVRPPNELSDSEYKSQQNQLMGWDFVLGESESDALETLIFVNDFLPSVQNYV